MKASAAPTAIDALLARAVSVQGLRALTALAGFLALVGALSALLPGAVWGSHAIGQLSSLAQRPGLGSWWGLLVGIDGIAGGAAIFATARKLGASAIAASLAGLLWAMCPAREWQLSVALAPTFIVPVFSLGLIASLEGGAVMLGIAGAALLLAVVFAPAEALAMAAIGCAFAIAHRGIRANLRLGAIRWLPWVIAAVVYIALAPHRVATALAASGALLGSPDDLRSLAGDGAMPWEAIVPASFLTTVFAAEHHAGVALALCISPGLALIVAALAFLVLRQEARDPDIGPSAALAIAFGLYVALPSQWAGVPLPTPAAALTAVMPSVAGIALAGIGISVMCALLGALVLDSLFSQPSGAWRSIGAAVVALAVIGSSIPTGPRAARLDESPTIAAELWTAQRAGGGTIAYYPFVDAASPRGAELAFVEAATGVHVLDLHPPANDRAQLADLTSAGAARRLRAHGVKLVIVELRAYGDPLVAPALAPWVWLPDNLRSEHSPPRVPEEFSPIRAFDDGAIVVYAL